MSVTENITEAIKKGSKKEIEKYVPQAFDEGVSLCEIMNALVVGMDDVGKRFKAGEIFVPEVLVASRAMNAAMAVLDPKLKEAGIKPDHKVVLGTVQGDLHDIGKNLVGMMLKGANFEVIDLGTDVTPEKFVEASKEHNADICALSALLTTTMPSMNDTVKAIRSAGLKTKVIIGGAPVTQEFCDEIQADGYAPDAASAVDVARELVKMK